MSLQSEIIIFVQRLILIFDLLALMSFTVYSPRRSLQLQHHYFFAWLAASLIPAIVLTINFAYLNVVPADADEDTVHAKADDLPSVFLPLYVIISPLDLVTCPYWGWGCRFLRVDHRTFVNRVWDPKEIAELRNGKLDHQTKSVSAIEGVDLRNRSLRFAVLDGSFLVAANLTNTDLRKATLTGAWLSFAQLRSAKLQGADLTNAHLEDSDMMYASLRGARLKSALLKNAKLTSSDLTGSDLRLANLAGAQLGSASLIVANLLQANLEGANLERVRAVGADFHDAKLNGARLSDADLRTADFSGCEMITADLHGANVSLANLEGAYLIGANLSQARLQGANLADIVAVGVDLSHSSLWRTKSTSDTALSLADLRSVDFSTELTKPALDELSAIITQALPAVAPDEREYFQSLQERISTLQTEKSDTYQLDLIATSDQQVLVNDPNDAHFNQKARGWLTKSITPNYRKYLAELASGLADEATFSQGISKIIVRRLHAIVLSSHDVTEDDKSRYLIMGCALSDYTKGDESKITPALLQELLGALRSEHAPCARPTDSKLRKQK